MAEDTAHSFTQPGVTWASAALLQHCRPLSATVHSTQLLAAEETQAAISDVLWPSHDGVQVRPVGVLSLYHDCRSTLRAPHWSQRPQRHDCRSRHLPRSRRQVQAMLTGVTMSR